MPVALRALFWFNCAAVARQYMTCGWHEKLRSLTVFFDRVVSCERVKIVSQGYIISFTLH